MDKKIFFCPVCGRVEATDPATVGAGKICAFCQSPMAEKLTMNWDSVPPAARNDQRVKWIQEANLAQTFNADTYNRRMTDPIFATDDASAPAQQPYGYGAAPAPAQGYGGYGYGMPNQQPGANFSAGVGNFTGKVNSFINKGGKGKLWVTIVRIAAWVVMLGVAVYALLVLFGATVGGIPYNYAPFGTRLLLFITFVIAAAVSGALMMMWADLCENVMHLTNNSANISNQLKK